MRRVHILIVIFFHIASCLAFDNEAQIKSCQVGDVVQNECLKCICNTKHIYKCSSKQCSRNENFTRTDTNKACEPNVIYTTDAMTCICDKTGQWPHRKCKKVFQTLNTANSCAPNTYVILDCNVCRCGPHGRIEKERCTQNVCEKQNTRRFNNVYGSCEVKNWYSLAPCQFCFCISQNKLVCNTGNNYAKKLDLGTYHLNVCGKGMIYEAMALIPDNELNLRFGYFMNTSIINTPKKLTPKRVLKESPNVAKHEVKEKRIENIEDDKEQEKNESYSESEEEKPTMVKSVKNVASTQIYSDGEDTSKENGFYSDKKEQDSGMAIGVKVNQSPKRPTKTIKMTPENTEAKSTKDLKKLGQNLGMTLKMSIPHMLEQMFKMAFRKSMLSVSNDSKCVPGTTEAVKCNMCFCMKNGKLLCTNNICE